MLWSSEDSTKFSTPSVMSLLPIPLPRWSGRTKTLFTKALPVFSLSLQSAERHCVASEVSFNNLAHGLCIPNLPVPTMRFPVLATRHVTNGSFWACLALMKSWSDLINWGLFSKATARQMAMACKSWGIRAALMVTPEEVDVDEITLDSTDWGERALEKRSAPLQHRSNRIAPSIRTIRIACSILFVNIRISW